MPIVPPISFRCDPPPPQWHHFSRSLTIIDDCHWITVCVLKSRRWCVNWLKRCQFLHLACFLSLPCFFFFLPKFFLTLYFFYRAESITNQPWPCACILPTKLKRPTPGGNKMGQLPRFICFFITSSIFLNSTANGILTWVPFKLNIRPKNIKNIFRNYICLNSCLELLSLYAQSSFIIPWLGNDKFKLFILN